MQNNFRNELFILFEESDPNFFKQAHDIVKFLDPECYVLWTYL